MLPSTATTMVPLLVLLAAVAAAPGWAQGSLQRLSYHSMAGCCDPPTVVAIFPQSTCLSWTCAGAVDWGTSAGCAASTAPEDAMGPCGFSVADHHYDYLKLESCSTAATPPPDAYAGAVYLRRGECFSINGVHLRAVCDDMFARTASIYVCPDTTCSNGCTRTTFVTHECYDGLMAACPILFFVSPWFYISVSVLSFLVLVGLVACCCAHWRRRKQARVDVAMADDKAGLLVNGSTPYYERAPSASADDVVFSPKPKPKKTSQSPFDDDDDIFGPK